VSEALVDTACSNRDRQRLPAILGSCSRTVARLKKLCLFTLNELPVRAKTSRPLDVDECSAARIWPKNGRALHDWQPARPVGNFSIPNRERSQKEPGGWKDLLTERGAFVSHGVRAVRNSTYI
jgi:hypothetical protein